MIPADTVARLWGQVEAEAFNRKQLVSPDARRERFAALIEAECGKDAEQRLARAYMRLQNGDVPRGGWHWEVSAILNSTDEPIRASGGKGCAKGSDCERGADGYCARCHQGKYP